MIRVIGFGLIILAFSTALQSQLPDSIEPRGPETPRQPAFEDCLDDWIQGNGIVQKVALADACARKLRRSRTELEEYSDALVSYHGELLLYDGRLRSSRHPAYNDLAPLIRSEILKLTPVVGDYWAQYQLSRRQLLSDICRAERRVCILQSRPSCQSCRR